MCLVLFISCFCLMLSRYIFRVNESILTFFHAKKSFAEQFSMGKSWSDFEKPFRLVGRELKIYWKGLTSIPSGFFFPICLLLLGIDVISCLPTGVVVSFMKAGLGGSIQPSKNRNQGWFPNGIIDSSTQKIALS